MKRGSPLRFGLLILLGEAPWGGDRGISNVTPGGRGTEAPPTLGSQTSRTQNLFPFPCPEHIGTTLGPVQDPRHDEKEIGESVQVLERQRQSRIVVASRSSTVRRSALRHTVLAR